MLNFENLKNLQKHITYLQEIIQKEDIFIVWWSIRDILLWFEKDPKDIDITAGWNPQDIYEKIKKEDISIFKTDKFGTITIIPKSQKSIEKLQYELTPLRSEWNYEDFRHPWEINWTSDILLDSKRRDFSINCIYYYYCQIDIQTESRKKINKESEFHRILDHEWYIFLRDKNCLIIKDNDTIAKLFNDAKLDKDKLKELTNKWYFLDNDEKSGYWIQIIIDPAWWMQDLISKKIKAVWNPDDRFQEDALRIIRWVRIPNILNQKIEKKFKSEWLKELKTFDYDTHTWKSMKKNFFLVQFIAKERVKDEIMKSFKANNPFGFIVLLDELNILKYLFPSFYLCKNSAQPVRYHALDTFAHTLMTFYHVQKINKDTIVRFAMLYHDVWKPDQYYYASIWLEKEEIRKMHGSYVNHPISGKDMAIKDFKALWFSKKEVEEIWFYVREHLLIWEVLSANEENIPKKIKKLLSEIWYKRLLNLVDICIADRQWQYNPLQSSNIQPLKNLKNLIKDIYKKQWEFSQKDLAIDWNDIIKELGIQAWPEVWKKIKKALDWTIQDIKNRNNKKAIIDFLKQN